MAICSAISKYGINNFTLYILESYDPSFVSLKEARENVLSTTLLLPFKEAVADRSQIALIGDNEKNTRRREQEFLSMKEEF
jgi:hypothetical protein